MSKWYVMEAWRMLWLLYEPSFLVVCSPLTTSDAEYFRLVCNVRQKFRFAAYNILQNPLVDTSNFILY